MPATSRPAGVGEDMALAPVLNQLAGVERLADGWRVAPWLIHFILTHWPSVEVTDVLFGGKSFGNIRHWQPVNRIAFTTSRRSVVGMAAAAGQTPHSASVRLIGKIIGFDKTVVKTYPVFKNPAVSFDVGENLCKLGFPFHSIKPTFDEGANMFQLPVGALPIPLFPIEGIFTRTVIVKDEKNQTASAEFVETSSPGLRGQSGGPTFDAQGRVWAMQSKTVHLPLGFSPEVPNHRNREHQFLNAGMGTHANTIIPILKGSGVNFSISKD